MPIEDRNLQAGTVLVGRHKGTEHRCEVVDTPEGVRYQVDGGEIFRSPSSAAKHVTRGAINGWVFWSLEGTEKAKREPKAKADKPKKETAARKETAGKKLKAPATKKGKAKSAKMGKSARMASAASYGCGACGEVFPTQKAAVAHAMTHTSS